MGIAWGIGRAWRTKSRDLMNSCVLLYVKFSSCKTHMGREVVERLC
jgi:hypothetical protein